MILIVNTTDNTDITRKLTNFLTEGDKDFEVVEAANKQIGNCVGCGHCWLREPGECVLRDDYEEIIKKILRATQLWVISDTALGFINHKGKNIFDRIVPVLNMYPEFRGGQMRHTIRYDTRTDVGIIYQGEADRDFLQGWNERCTMNLDCRPLGAYPVAEWEEAAACMQ